MNYRIKSFLSARLHLSPQSAGERIYFVSNLSGKLSLYGMYYGGSVPEPLLPPHIAMQNPDLVGGYSFFVFPAARPHPGDARSRWRRELPTDVDSH